jgi:hypothetical protein
MTSVYRIYCNHKASFSALGLHYLQSIISKLVWLCIPERTSTLTVKPQLEKECSFRDCATHCILNAIYFYIIEPGAATLGHQPWMCCHIPQSPVSAPTPFPGNGKICPPIPTPAGPVWWRYWPP